jgi:two-component system cell cycle response regulator
MAIEDELTGLYNRRYFLSVLEGEIVRDRRYKHGLALCLIDLDHFKKINDTYGHITGDMVLRELGGMIQECFRQCDTCCRYGGDEFAVILPDTRVEAGRVACERLREAVANRMFAVESSSFGITISSGVVEYAGSAGESAEAFMTRADEALYTSKREGGNRVVALGNPMVKAASEESLG